MSDVATMEAGRELDARVHELMTGERIVCLHQRTTPVSGSLVRCDDCGEEFGSTTLAMARNTWPRYTTDMNAAWKVAEKFKLVVFPRMSQPGWCAVPWMETRLNEHGYGVLPFYAKEAGKADTAPLAICRAALAALDAKREG